MPRADIHDHSWRSDVGRLVPASAPLREERIDVAGVSTSLLSGGRQPGGSGPPVVFLHGQGGFAAMWLPVAGSLVTTRRVLAPDLPGLGASTIASGPPSAAAVIAWLDALIDRTCERAPVLVGHSLGGSIAARFAAEHSDRLSALVLVNAGGLAGRVRPAPSVLFALIRQSVRPTERNALRLFERLTADLDAVRERMGARWNTPLAYIVELSRTASVQQANRRLLREAGLRGIPAAALSQISVPTSMIWGRLDKVMPLKGAQHASDRYGWNLRIIDDAGHLPHLEQPEATLQALRIILGDDKSQGISYPGVKP